MLSTNKPNEVVYIFILEFKKKTILPRVLYTDLSSLMLIYIFLESVSNLSKRRVVIDLKKKLYYFQITVSEKKKFLAISW